MQTIREIGCPVDPNAISTRLDELDREIRKHRADSGDVLAGTPVPEDLNAEHSLICNISVLINDGQVNTDALLSLTRDDCEILRELRNVLSDDSINFANTSAGAQEIAKKWLQLT